MNLNIELTLDEVNTILRCLGKHPFEEISNLIGKITQQGELQIAVKNAKDAENAKADATETEETPSAE
jgi:hypothetical protein